MDPGTDPEIWHALQRISRLIEDRDLNKTDGIVELVKKATAAVSGTGDPPGTYDGTGTDGKQRRRDGDLKIINLTVDNDNCEFNNGTFGKLKEVETFLKRVQAAVDHNKSMLKQYYKQDSEVAKANPRNG